MQRGKNWHTVCIVCIAWCSLIATYYVAIAQCFTSWHRLMPAVGYFLRNWSTIIRSPNIGYVKKPSILVLSFFAGSLIACTDVTDRPATSRSNVYQRLGPRSNVIYSLKHLGYTSPNVGKGISKVPNLALIFDLVRLWAALVSKNFETEQYI